MEAKEKVKDFNIRFNTLSKKIPANARPTDEVLMEFYITTLPIPTAMWVKRSNAKTLQGSIDEAIKFENEMISRMTCHHTTKGRKPLSHLRIIMGVITKWLSSKKGTPQMWKVCIGSLRN